MKYRGHLPLYGIAVADGYVYLGRLSRNGAGYYVNGIRLRPIDNEMISGSEINPDVAFGMLDLLVNPGEGRFRFPKNSLMINYMLTKQDYDALRTRLLSQR